MNERTQISPVTLALWALGAYIVIKYVLPLITTLGKGASAAVNTVSSGIAQTYVGLTSGPDIQLIGGIYLPDGSTIPIQSIVSQNITPDAAGNVHFIWAGTKYQLLPGVDPYGNYQAVGM